MKRTIWLGLLLLLAVGQVQAEQFTAGWDAYSRQDYATALRIWTPLAEQGHGPAQHNLGHLYAFGHGVSQDDALAVGWYRQAAGQGIAASQYQLGSHYATGRGVPRDESEALAWYRKAAEQDYAPAQTALGHAYVLGSGVLRDESQAVAWYRRAAAQGDTEAIGHLGFYYEHGRGGVARDLTLAMDAYRIGGEHNPWMRAQYQRLAGPVAGEAPEPEVIVTPERSWVPWWLRGFSISPGVGARHLGLHVTRTADGHRGSLAASPGDNLFYSLDIESPRWSFGGGPLGLSVLMHSGNVRLNEQWFSDGGTNVNGTASGFRDDVGTSVSGYYSYIMPALSLRSGQPGTDGWNLAIGYGTWIARMSGDIILTPDDRPHAGMQTTDVDISVRRSAYLALLSYRTNNGWLFQMTGGGPKFSDDSYRYRMEEIALTVGYRFTF